MFIAYTKNNEYYIENSDFEGRTFVWNDIPQDTSITALSLTHPADLTINGKRVSPKINIKKYHYYYFFNEATVSVTQTNERSKPFLTAKIIAGIDVEKEYVLEVRLDRNGNTSLDHYPLSALVNKFQNGTMNRSILRTGIPCAKEKELL